MADPGFSRRVGGDVNPEVGQDNLLFDQMLPEHCMKVKELVPRTEASVPGVLPLNLPITMALETVKFQYFSLNDAMYPEF